MGREKPLILSSTHVISTEGEPKEFSLTLPYKKGARVAHVAWKLPPDFAADPAIGYTVLSFGFAYAVDMEQKSVSEPVRLKAFVDDAFVQNAANTGNATKDQPAAVRKRESLRAAIDARPNLAAAPWVLIAWSTPRHDVWRLDEGHGTKQDTGALRVVYPAKVKTERAK